MILTKRWTKLNYHEEQVKLWQCDKRFIVVPSGRRSGKTELAKRKLIKRAITFKAAPNGRFVLSAPTYAQAKEIFWEDAKAMIPEWAFETTYSKSIRESGLVIKLWNGARIIVMGMDKPERVEGPALDGIVFDEYGNMKKEVWTQHVRPALSTVDRPGWAWFIGVPEGRNHYYDLRCDAIEGKEDWGHFTWFTSDINPEEAEAAKNEMDLLTWQQEYEGAFISFEGRAYYAFGEHNITPKGIRNVYDEDLDLIFAFDFNVSPGTASIIQEQKSPEWLNKINHKELGNISVGLDEVFIERNSNTELICDKLIEKWGHHKGIINIHGDPSGGAKKSSGVKGSDWDLIEQKLGPVFGDRLRYLYARKAPSVKARINATNSRCRSVNGLTRLILDRETCKMTIRDFEGVSLDEDGGLADKTGMLTHLTDGWGYYIEEQHPVWNTTITKEAA